MRFMPSKCGWVIGLVAVVGVSSASAQTGNAVPVLYELTKDSTYQIGCFPPCLCPIGQEQSVSGTFKLTPTGSDPLYQHYAVTDVHWTVAQPDAPLVITGSGEYKRGGEFALTHQLTLDLKVGDDPVQHFDSSVVVGGGDFPKINIVISINGAYCFDTVIAVHAQPAPPSPPMPRHAAFIVLPHESAAELSLFTGGTRSPVAGSLRLFLGDPSVPVIALVGMVGLSVDGADLVALNWDPDLPGLPEPMRMIQDPHVRSIGAWNTITGQISFELHLIAPNGNLPVPMPLHLSGTLREGRLQVEGNNGNVADALMTLRLNAIEANLPSPPIDIWFSTENGFHAGSILPPVDAAPFVSGGDLLSRRGYIVRTNHQLTSQLGIMPVVPDLGLDAVVQGRRGSIWFSFEEQNGPIWSESLAVWLKHGDLLSDAGFVVATNEKLVAKFAPISVTTEVNPDLGLDAVTMAPNGAILFSTERDFMSHALNRKIGHGDLLSDRGRIVRTNAQLLANFHIDASTEQPTSEDYGLDAVVLRSNREIWFSTEIGFLDANLGWVSDGDLLSTTGRVVVRNLDLVQAFGPLEDVANFGLDAVTLVVPRPCRFDFDLDGDVDVHDFLVFQACYNGPHAPPNTAYATMSDFDADLDGDTDVDVADFAEFQVCFNGPDNPPACD